MNDLTRISWLGWPIQIGLHLGTFVLLTLSPKVRSIGKLNDWACNIIINLTYISFCCISTLLFHIPSLSLYTKTLLLPWLFQKSPYLKIFSLAHENLQTSNWNLEAGFYGKFHNHITENNIASSLLIMYIVSRAV